MSETTKVNGLSADNATLLLAAAEDLGLNPSVVTVSSGQFIAPTEVVKKAGLMPDKSKPNAERRTARSGSKPKKAAAKKTAAKPQDTSTTAAKDEAKADTQSTKEDN